MSITSSEPFIASVFVALLRDVLQLFSAANLGSSPTKKKPPYILQTVNCNVNWKLYSHPSQPSSCVFERAVGYQFWRHWFNSHRWLSP